MTTDLLRRVSLVLRADPSRVIAKLFLPGQETLANGISRADQVIHRVLAMKADQVTRTLTDTVHRFGDRHADLPGILRSHFELVAHRLPAGSEISDDRAALIGAYFTQEYSIEAAALFNPSMVAHPDQSGLGRGELRFVMSVRAVGEGHVSSIEFRTGVLTVDGDVRLDGNGRHLTPGRPGRRTMAREFVAAALEEHATLAPVGDVFSLLPAEFDAADLERAVAAVHHDWLTRGSAEVAIDRIRGIMARTYRVHFDPERPLSERVLLPVAPDESHGVEDARFTLFVDDTGESTYYGTFTAFDGVNIEPRLIQTKDFQNFDISQLIGPAAKDKGMAIFPRRVLGRYLALSRWDRESIGIASSADARQWGDARTIQTPEQPWEVVQLGNCGPPIETEAGWLVLTHGVGPMRQYAIGATLLDLDNPTKLIGALAEPLLTPDENEREGYVPNVVYSCGALRHGDTLVLPYGCSDSAIRIAFIDLPRLLERLASA